MQQVSAGMPWQMTPLPLQEVELTKSLKLTAVVQPMKVARKKGTVNCIVEVIWWLMIWVKGKAEGQGWKVRVI